MLYIEFLKSREAYDISLKQLRKLLDKREEIFLMTLPSGIRYDMEKISRSVTTNAMDAFIMRAEEVEEKIRAVKIQLDDRKNVLDGIEKELRESKVLADEIFVHKHLDGKKVPRVAAELHYSQERIYQVDREIKDDITVYYRTNVLKL